MKKPAFLVLLLFVLSCHMQALAQTSPDTVNRNIAMNAIRSQYARTIGISSYLYNGPAYVVYWNGFKGDPFLSPATFQQGDLYYGGALYQNVQLKYDISHDELITRNFTNEVDIALISEKVEAFTMGNRVFVRITPDATQTGLSTAGFYEQLYKGTTAVYVRHEKRVEKSAKAEDNIIAFKEHTTYYLEKEGVFHTVTGEGDLASLLKDQRQEIKKFLGRKDINYKKDPAGTIVQTAALYDKLKK